MNLQNIIKNMLTRSKSYIDNKANESKNYTYDWNCEDKSKKDFIFNKPSSLPANGGNADKVSGYSVWTGSQNQYDSLSTKDPGTLYFIANNLCQGYYGNGLVISPNKFYNYITSNPVITLQDLYNTYGDNMLITFEGDMNDIWPEIVFYTYSDDDEKWHFYCYQGIDMKGGADDNEHFILPPSVDNIWDNDTGKIQYVFRKTDINNDDQMKNLTSWGYTSDKIAIAFTLYKESGTISPSDYTFTIQSYEDPGEPLPYLDLTNPAEMFNGVTSGGVNFNINYETMSIIWPEGGNEGEYYVRYDVKLDPTVDYALNFGENSNGWVYVEDGYGQEIADHEPWYISIQGKSMIRIYLYAGIYYNISLYEDRLTTNSNWNLNFPSAVAAGQFSAVSNNAVNISVDQSHQYLTGSGFVQYTILLKLNKKYEITIDSSNNEGWLTIYKDFDPVAIYDGHTGTETKPIYFDTVNSLNSADEVYLHIYMSDGNYSNLQINEKDGASSIFPVKNVQVYNDTEFGALTTSSYVTDSSGSMGIKVVTHSSNYYAYTTRFSFDKKFDMSKIEKIIMKWSYSGSELTGSKGEVFVGCTSTTYNTRGNTTDFTGKLTEKINLSQGQYVIERAEFVPTNWSGEHYLSFGICSSVNGTALTIAIAEIEIVLKAGSGGSTDGGSTTPGGSDYYIVQNGVYKTTNEFTTQFLMGTSEWASDVTPNSNGNLKFNLTTNNNNTQCVVYYYTNNIVMTNYDKLVIDAIFSYSTYRKDGIVFGIGTLYNYDDDSIYIEPHPDAYLTTGDNLQNGINEIDISNITGDYVIYMQVMSGSYSGSTPITINMKDLYLTGPGGTIGGETALEFYQGARIDSVITYDPAYVTTNQINIASVSSSQEIIFSIKSSMEIFDATIYADVWGTNGTYITHVVAEELVDFRNNQHTLITITKVELAYDLETTSNNIGYIALTLSHGGYNIYSDQFTGTVNVGGSTGGVTPRDDI